MRLFLGSAGVSALPEFMDGRRVIYVPTAGKPMADGGGGGESRAALVDLGFEITDLDIDGATQDEIRGALDDADGVFVEGGSPFFLLQAMRESGFDSVVVELVRDGLPYVGMSAGGVVAGPDLEPLSTTSNTSLGPRLESTEGLGLVNLVVFPHYDAPGRASEFPDVLLRFGSRFRLLPLTDAQALVVDEDGMRIVASE